MSWRFLAEDVFFDCAKIFNFVHLPSQLIYHLIVLL